MKLLAFSDWRIQEIDDVFKFIESLLEPVDLILYAGDDIGRFHGRRRNYFTELAKYTRQKKVLAVVGNDDTYQVKSILQSENVHDLHEDPFVTADLGFMGLEGSTSGPAFVSHSEKYVQNHLKRQHEKIKFKKPIIVSHPPPHGVLDYGIRFASEEEGAHNIGSKSLRNFIQRNDVQLVVCGHCHSQGGLSKKIKNTTVANVSSHDNPGSQGNFAIIDIHSSNPPYIQWYDTRGLIEPNSILRIHSVGQQTALKLKRAKIKTIQDLAKAKNLKRISMKTNFSEVRLNKLQLKARSVVENKVFQISDLVLPSNNLIFFDIETDLACKKVWLVGMLSNEKFTQFYAKNWSHEKAMLKRFLTFLRKNPNSTLVSFSGTSFDRNVVHKALVRLNLDSDFFFSFPHIDLCQLLRNSFIFPNQSFALKELGTHLEYPFEHPDLSGLGVALEYLGHLKEKRKLDSRVLEYNRDDVQAIPYIIKKIASEGFMIKREGYDTNIRTNASHHPTYEETVILEKLRRKGMTLQEISERCNKSIFYVYSRLNSKYRYNSSYKSLAS